MNAVTWYCIEWWNQPKIHSLRSVQCTLFILIVANLAANVNTLCAAESLETGFETNIKQSVRTILESIVMDFFFYLVRTFWQTLFWEYIWCELLSTHTRVPSEKKNNISHLKTKKNSNNKNLRISWVNRLMITSHAAHMIRYILYWTPIHTFFSRSLKMVSKYKTQRFVCIFFDVIIFFSPSSSSFSSFYALLLLFVYFIYPKFTVFLYSEKLIFLAILDLD